MLKDLNISRDKDRQECKSSIHTWIILAGFCIPFVSNSGLKYGPLSEASLIGGKGSGRRLRFLYTKRIAAASKAKNTNAPIAIPTMAPVDNLEWEGSLLLLVAVAVDVDDAVTPVRETVPALTVASEDVVDRPSAFQRI